MQFHSLQIPPPKGWEDFEALCLDLFRRVWADPWAQRNGRGGQAQAGTDVWGRPDGGHAGVQCKGKDVGLGRAVTERELRDEVAKALTFRPALTEWVLATTAPKDARIERIAREITAEHERRGLFRVHVFGWDDLLGLLADHREIVEKHYPDFRSSDPALGAMRAENATRHEEVLAKLERLEGMMAAVSTVGAPIPDPAPGPAVDVADLTLQTLIDAARDLQRAGKPLTALRSYERLVVERWEGASERAKFRLLTNQGACHYRLGSWREAADLLDRARVHGGDDVQAVTNAALAAVLRGDATAARALADEALAREPASPDAASLRILAAFDEAGVGDPLALVPIDVATAAPVLAMAARWHREQGHSDECRELLERAYALTPEDPDLKVDLAVALADPIARAGADFRSRTPSASVRDDVARAAGLLRDAWDGARDTEVAAQKVEAALNLALVLDLEGREEEAGEVLLEALRVAPGDERVIRQRVHQLSRAGRHKEALECLERLRASPEEDTELAVAKFRVLAGVGRYEEALALHGRLEPRLEGHRRVGVRADKVRLLWALGRRDEARDEADGLVGEAPGESRYLLASAFVRQRTGDEEGARLALRDAVRAMPADDALGRSLAAEALFSLSDWEGVAEALSGVVRTDRDDHDLRTLLAALVNADRRREARDLLDVLPGVVADDPFYHRAAARLGAVVGDLALTRLHAERVLAVEPNDLETALLWLETVCDEGDEDAANRFLDGDLSRFAAASVRSRVALARTLDRLGRHERAVATAYDTLRGHWDDREAHRGYGGLMLGSRGAVAAIPAMDAIGPDAGFLVASSMPGGFPTSFLIETRSIPLDSRLGEVDPRSSVASRALGLRAGGRLRIHDHPAADEVEILEVGHKYLRLGRRSLADFSSLFPDDRSFFGFAMDPDDPSKAIGKIREMALQRREQAEGVAEAYSRGNLPIGIVARLAGTEPVSAWFGIAATSRTLNVCTGERAELSRAMDLLSRRPGLVVDPLTFWLAGGHGWLDTLRATFGPLGITRSCLDALRRMAEDRASSLGGGSGMMSASPQDGTIVLTETTPEQRRLSRDAADRILAFATGEGAVILDAMPRRDFEAATRDVGRRMDPAFLDAVAAADGTGRVLLCEDGHMRSVAAECRPGGVPSVWLQPALMAATSVGTMSRSDYVDASVALALSGHDFTMLDAGSLTLVARRNRWITAGEFERLAAVVGAARVDLRTATTVVATFLNELWSARVPPTAQETLTTTVVGALTRGHPQQAEAVVDALNRRADPRPADGLRPRLRARARLSRVLARVVAELRRPDQNASRPDDQPSGASAV